MHNFLFAVFLFWYTNFMNAQYIVQKNRGHEVNDQKVGNIQFHPKNNPLIFPAMSLYEILPLELKFDILSTQEEQFFYTIELCNYDWTPSNLDVMDYIDGYSENTIYAFSSSFNTTLDYVQYKMEIPNNDIRFLKSGNYILHVFKSNEDKLFSRRFIVYEPSVEVNLQLDNFQSDIYGDRQSINAVVAPQSNEFAGFSGDIHLSVIQNGNWNQVKSFNKYYTNGEGQLLFNGTGQIVFDGMNEYRFFDIKSLKFISDRIERIEYMPPNYHVYLKPDKLRGNKNYFTNVDLNGEYFIWNQESNDENLLDADYAYVHFRLDTEIPLGSDIYIEGALSDWKLDDNSMEFNTESGFYESTLLLKQGIYNYRYVTKDYNSNKVYCDITEGNFYQTGNDYRAFLYYRELGGIYDRVIGYGILSTGEPIKEFDKEKELTPIQKILKEIAPR
jgi:hypothetical protein